MKEERSAHGRFEIRVIPPSFKFDASIARMVMGGVVDLTGVVGLSSPTLSLLLLSIDDEY